MTLATTIIPLNNGTKICAPADIQLMSNFVLREQGDWFEDEIHFVRQYIEEGMMTLDIGANYGLYATAIASNLGKTGKLWCFEPTPDTASALRETMATNSFDAEISVIEAGLSDHAGQATFYTSPNAELNSLTASADAEGEQQTIDLLTLDQCYQQYQWPRLDFIKLDAEGEELKILKAASATLSECSPLIMFELKHTNQVNLPLINAFHDMGYESFTLIPGLNILAPFDEQSPLDGYQLNLFCCKADLAAKLEERGLLTRQTQARKTSAAIDVSAYLKSLPALAKLDLVETDNTAYGNALEAYVASQDSSLSADDRHAFLCHAFELAETAMNQNETRIERLSSYSRIAFDLGKRDFGLRILGFTIDNYFRTGRSFEVREQFLPANARFEKLDPGTNPRAWFAAAMLDQYVIKHAFSSYFTAGTALPFLGQLRSLGYLLPDMDQREKLIKERLG